MRKCTILSGDKMLGFKKKGGKTGPDEEATRIYEMIQKMTPEQQKELQKELEILMKDPDLEKPRRDGEALKKEIMEEATRIHEMIQKMTPEQQKELLKGILEILMKDPDLEKPRRDS